MSLTLPKRIADRDWIKEIEELSGENLFACYQCGKCSAGCPLAFAMDLLPHQVIRLLQLELVNEVLNSSAPWFCVGCLTCATRCPKGVDLAKVMEAIRTLLLREGKEERRPFPLPTEIMTEAPQQASVSAFRKLSL
ncbi:MAG: 4Fe-4S dicluster domain-containing protein [Armatimonadetes bacterium]|nr:4Fe-4S dicluster domain-containing protein [Armatimonadota bacterium]MDW8122325.1 4Fe-4S dicluster domain-containing protein [Armatimonadota bacterium]